MSVKVTVSGADSSSSPVWLMVGLVCGVSLIIILLLLLYRCRQSKCADKPPDVIYSNIELEKFGNKRKHHKPEQSAVYANVKTGAAENAALYESVTHVEDTRNGVGDPKDVTYSLTKLKNIGNKRRLRRAEESDIYSDVKMGAAEDNLMYAEINHHKKEKAKKNKGKSSPESTNEAVYSEVKLERALEDSPMYAQVSRRNKGNAKTNKGKSSLVSADEAVYSEVKRGSTLGQ
ncbi:uncharacterized protein LOC102081169 isoform X1 [Oreochromis niloticus]|uniref:uncharacterized protein LOC102081169 isoform X1 n=1 Tax=Oreochromis niloticus TaxID=8128 RepID=UPI000DF1CCB2|nr:uncharacterized protein LOC102081169 isoform X1 [Oreochromis niloticus]